MTDKTQEQRIQDVLVTFNIKYENMGFPEPTRERVMADLEKMGRMGDIGYTEIRTNAVNTHELPIQADLFEEINKEPITSELETFGDIDSMMREAQLIVDNVEREVESIGTSSRVPTYTAEDNDPFNE